MAQLNSIGMETYSKLVFDNLEQKFVSSTSQFVFWGERESSATK